MNNRTNRTKNIDGFLCCKIQTEPEEEKPNRTSPYNDFPEELKEFITGFCGKK